MFGYLSPSCLLFQVCLLFHPSMQAAAFFPVMYCFRLSASFFSESGIPSLQWIPQSLKVTLRICVNRLRPPRGTKSGHSVLSISVFRTASADSHGRSSRSRLHTGIEWTGVARWPVGNNACCVSLQIRVWFIEIMVDGKNQPKGGPLTFTCTHDTCKYSLTQNTQQQTNKTQKLLEV